MYTSYPDTLIPLNRYLPRDAPPKSTPTLQHANLYILKPIRFDNELLSRRRQQRHARLRGISELVSVRVASLEKGGKGACEAGVDEGLGLLDGVYLVPLSVGRGGGGSAGAWFRNGGTRERALGEESLTYWVSLPCVAGGMVYSPT